VITLTTDPHHFYRFISILIIVAVIIVTPVCSEERSRLMVVIDWGDAGSYPDNHRMVITPDARWLQGTITDDQGTHRVLFLDQWRRDGRLINWVDPDRGPQHVYRGDAGNHTVTVRSYYSLPTGPISAEAGAQTVTDGAQTVTDGAQTVTLEDGTLAYVEEVSFKPPATGSRGEGPQDAAALFTYGQDTPAISLPIYTPSTDDGEGIPEDETVAFTMAYSYPARNPDHYFDFYGEWTFLVTGPENDVRIKTVKSGLQVECNDYTVPSSPHYRDDMYQSFVVPRLLYSVEEPGLSSVEKGIGINTRINYYVEIPGDHGGPAIPLYVKDEVPPSRVIVDLAGADFGTTGDAMDAARLVVEDNNPNLRPHHMSARISFGDLEVTPCELGNPPDDQVLVRDPIMYARPGHERTDSTGEYGLVAAWRLPETLRLPLKAKGRIRPVALLKGFGLVEELERLVDEPITVFDDDAPNIYIHLSDGHHLDRWYTDPAAAGNDDGVLATGPETYQYIDDRPVWTVDTGGDVFEKTRLLVEVFVVDNVRYMDGLPLGGAHLASVTVRKPSAVEIVEVLPRMQPRGEGMLYRLEKGINFRSPGDYTLIVETRDRARSLGEYGLQDNRRELTLTIVVQDTRLRHDRLD